MFVGCHSLWEFEFLCIGRNRLQSVMLKLIESVMSFMYSRKRTGPSTEH